MENDKKGHWGDADMRALALSEALALEGARSGDIEKMAHAEDMNARLRKNPGLAVAAYRRDGAGGWAPAGIMGYGAYHETMRDDPGGYACHPVNFDSLESFDAWALGVGK